MSTRRERLRAFVEQKLEEAEPQTHLDLEDDTSLLRSRLLDSLAILQLAEWIEGELGKPLDLESLEIAKEWDTIGLVLDFLEGRNR